MRNDSKTLGILTLLAVVGFIALPSTAAAQGWQWSVTPYTWLPGIEAEVEIGDTNIIDSRVSTHDLVSDTKFLAAVHLEGQNGAWGMLFDANYMNIGNSRVVAELPGGTVEFKSDLKMNFIEAAGVWAPSGEPTGFGLIFGTRIFDVAQKYDLDVHPVTGGTYNRHYSISPTLLDAMVGFRYLSTIGQRGSFNLRADYSAGGTDTTMNGLIGLGYSFDPEGKYTLMGGYRYMYIDLKEKDQNAEVQSKLTLDGPYAAFKFGF
jgi:hypothetical protein